MIIAGNPDLAIISHANHFLFRPPDHGGIHLSLKNILSRDAAFFTDTIAADQREIRLHRLKNLTRNRPHQLLFRVANFATGQDD